MYDERNLSFMNMNHIEPIGWLSGYFKIPLALGAILILADILILLISPPGPDHPSDRIFCDHRPRLF